MSKMNQKKRKRIQEDEDDTDDTKETKPLQLKKIKFNTLKSDAKLDEKLDKKYKNSSPPTDTDKTIIINSKIIQLCQPKIKTNKNEKETLAMIRSIFKKKDYARIAYCISTTKSKFDINELKMIWEELKKMVTLGSCLWLGDILMKIHQYAATKRTKIFYMAVFFLDHSGMGFTNIDKLFYNDFIDVITQNNKNKTNLHNNVAKHLCFSSGSREVLYKLLSHGFTLTHEFIHTVLETPIEVNLNRLLHLVFKPGEYNFKNECGPYGESDNKPPTKDIDRWTNTTLANMFEKIENEDPGFLVTIPHLKTIIPYWSNPGFEFDMFDFLSSNSEIMAAWVLNPLYCLPSDSPFFDQENPDWFSVNQQCLEALKHYKKQVFSIMYKMLEDMPDVLISEIIEFL